MADLFERIAPSWAQSKKTMTLSLGEFAGKKCEACAISAQGKMKCVAQKSPAATNARSAAASRALVADRNGKRSRVCFRQRHGGGRCATAPFQPSLRLRFTLPPAKPLTEAVFQEPDRPCARHPCADRNLPRQMQIHAGQSRARTAARSQRTRLNCPRFRATPNDQQTAQSS